MPNLAAVLQAILTVSNQANQTPPYIVTYDFGNPTQNETVSFFDPYFQALNPGPTSVPLPAATVFAILVQNLHATALLDVTLTPTGHAASTQRIGPNGIVAIFDPNETGQGFTALSLSGVAGTVPAMVYVGA